MTAVESSHHALGLDRCNFPSLLRLGDLSGQALQLQQEVQDF